MATTKDLPPIPCDLVGIHELDPDGDVILAFNSKHAIVSDHDTVNLINAEDWNAMVEGLSEDEDDDYSSEESEESEESAAQSTIEEGADKQTSEAEVEEVETAEGQEGQQTAQQGEEEAEEEEEPEEEPDERYELGSADIEFRVSSRHLSFLSPYFRVLLSRKFVEGKKLHASGQVKITLEGDPAHGAKILLGLMHLNCNFPELTPSLMMQIAILVDKWDLSGPLAYWIQEMWKTFKHYLPDSWDPDSIYYLKMLHMLKLQSEGEELAELVAGSLTNDMCTDYPPLQQAIDTLQQHRITVLGDAFSSISSLIAKYCPAEVLTPSLCKFAKAECDALVLGLLLRELTLCQLYPLPEAPYHDISIDDLQTELESINLLPCCHGKSEPRWCKKCLDPYQLNSTHDHYCSSCLTKLKQESEDENQDEDKDCSSCGPTGECNILRPILRKLRASAKVELPWVK